MPDVVIARPDAAAIVDLLDRVVHRGAAITGNVVISLAGIDLVRLDLRALLIGIDGLGFA